VTATWSAIIIVTRFEAAAHAMLEKPVLIL
jgi:hypothetical protein